MPILPRLLLLPLLLATAVAQQPKVPSPVVPEPDLKATLPGPDPEAGRRAIREAVPADAAATKAADRLATTLAANLDRVFVDRTADGVTHAATPHYKAQFRPGTWSFFARPAAGATAYEPLAFTLDSVTIAGSVLPRCAGAVQVDGERVTLPHGPCREVVHLGTRAAEQTFVFDALPVRGELRVVVRPVTTMVGNDCGEGVRFTGRFQQVEYSEAVAIDARGDRIQAATDFADGVITIRVPAGFVAHAQLPLVIDPIVGSATLSQASANFEEPDLAFDDASGRWAVVYDYVFSLFDRDVYLQRLDGNLAPVGPLLGVDVSTDAWDYPRIANNNATNTFLVVAQVSGGASPYWIAGRTVTASGGMQSPFVIEQAGLPGHLGGDKLRPDVGGDCNPTGPSYFTVVWERVYSATDHDIHMKQVTPQGALVTNAPRLIDNSGFYDSRPAISNSNGGFYYTEQRWGVAFQRNAGAGNEDLRVAMLEWDGDLVTLVGNTTSVLVAAGLANQRSASISSPTLQRRMLCAYEDASSGNGDIGMVLLDEQGNQVAAGSLSALNAASSPASWIQRAPAVDTDGARFSIAFLEGYAGSTTDLDPYVSLVAEVGGALVIQNPPVWLGGSTYPSITPRIGGLYSGNGLASERFLIVSNELLPSQETIVLRSFDAVQDGPGLQTIAAGCGALTTNLAGSTVLGRTFFVSLTSASPLTGFLFGDFVPPTALPPCPGCTVVVGNPMFVVGSLLMANVPMQPNLVGSTFGAQGFAFGGGTCLGGFVLGDGVQITIR